MRSSSESRGRSSPRTVNWFAVSVIATVCCCHIQFVTSQRNSGAVRASNSPSNYKDAVLVYPNGIRSERDLPVCPSVIENPSTDVSLSSGFSSTGSAGNDVNRLQQPGSTKNPSDSKKSETKKYLSACNVVHRRYFFPPRIERLCRCPDRTDCPMQWSQPPSYKDLYNDAKQGTKSQPITTTPSTKSEQSMDPFTVMISSRSQLKFCAEVAANLPTCEKITSKHNKEIPFEESASMVKAVKNTFLAKELASVTVNCYCPPLFRGWTFLNKTEPVDYVNGTVTAAAPSTPEKSYYYRCDRLQKCRKGQQCGTVRTDYHFSFYHCSCPRKHVCVPKVYPPESLDDIINDAEEALYSGQVAPAFCTPE